MKKDTKLKIRKLYSNIKYKLKGLFIFTMKNAYRAIIIIAIFKLIGYK